jgi:hypothetical protein
LGSGVSWRSEVRSRKYEVRSTKYEVRICQVRGERTAAPGADGGDPVRQRDERTESGPRSDPAYAPLTEGSDPVLAELWDNDEDAVYDDFAPQLDDYGEK